MALAGQGLPVRRHWSPTGVDVGLFFSGLARFGVIQSIMTIVFDKRRLGLYREPRNNDNDFQ